MKRRCMLALSLLLILLLSGCSGTAKDTPPATSASDVDPALSPPRLPDVPDPPASRPVADNPADSQKKAPPATGDTIMTRKESQAIRALREVAASTPKDRPWADTLKNDVEARVKTPD